MGILKRGVIQYNTDLLYYITSPPLFWLADPLPLSLLQKATLFRIAYLHSKISHSESRIRIYGPQYALMGAFAQNPKQGDNVNWIERPFIDYLNAVDAEMERRYGVTSDDTGMEMIAAAQESLETPTECAEEIGRKYELEEIT